MPAHAPRHPARPAPANRDDLREAMLDAAAAILAKDGPAGLNLRKLAAMTGASTMAVYSLFGGKDGLLDALYTMTMERLGMALQAVPEMDDPRDWIDALAWAYRGFARSYPALYGIVAGQTVPLRRVASDQLRVRSGFATLKTAVTKLLARHDHARRFTAEEVASALWATLHGVVSLELVGHLDAAQAEAILRNGSRGVLDAYLAKMTASGGAPQP